ncbi:MAG: sulfurtransferase TusA family protein [Proteobacteria bacterium]|jgi:tRNA 2-thiouridine synthesizing protein A|nr:sulfurtransferase TusA family protein [Pseudomonadota bacterium]
MIELNLKGLNCPLPVLKTKKFLMSIDANTKICIYTTDPASLSDLKDFCKKTGNILLSQSQKDGIITTVIQRKNI